MLVRMWCTKVTVICIGILGLLNAQTPFDCNGRNFRVIEKGSGTYLQEIFIDAETLASKQEDLGFFRGYQVNGICYRPADNLIYGILLGEPYGLCRIDADYNIERLADLPLPTNFLFVAGDISPDGRYLTLLSSSRNEPTNLLAQVDLEDPHYSTTVKPLMTNDGGPAIFCADIAFHPTTGTLYGFNNTNDKVVAIDIEKGVIDNKLFSEQYLLKGNVPTLFFDGRGNLMAVGALEDGYRQRHLLRFNLEDGSASLIESYGEEGNQDGCSCPYTVEVLNEIAYQNLFPCTEVAFKITLINRTPFEQDNLLLTSPFAEGITIQSVGDFPFPGATIEGIGSNTLMVDGFDLPPGVFEFTVLVQVEADIVPGWYTNQVVLEPVVLSGEATIVYSDDPGTILKTIRLNSAFLT